MFEELRSIYQGKKVFLTGHTGFKGSWLLKLLSMLGAEVKGFALSPNSKEDLFCLIQGGDICESIIGDLRDQETLVNELVKFEPDFVFHLAAQPLVRLSYEIPSETFEVNAIGTANLLNGVKKLNKPCCVVLITTDKVYHNNEWVYPYRETDRLGGYDPYSASKACAELIISSYRNSFFNVENYNIHQKAISVARAGNVIGGGDWSRDRLIPDIVKSLRAEEEIIIRNPQAVRPWQHVLEPLTGYLLLGVKMFDNPGKYIDAYNFGPYGSDALPVVQMVDLALEAWGKGSYQVLQNPGQPHEAGLLKLDISKSISELGWVPKMNALAAVSYTLNWYKEFSDKKSSIDEFTEYQIMNFLK